MEGIKNGNESRAVILLFIYLLLIDRNQLTKKQLHEALHAEGEKINYSTFCYSLQKFKKNQDLIFTESREHHPKRKPTFLIGNPQ